MKKIFLSFFSTILFISSLLSFNLSYKNNILSKLDSPIEETNTQTVVSDKETMELSASELEFFNVNNAIIQIIKSNQQRLEDVMVRFNNNVYLDEQQLQDVMVKLEIGAILTQQQLENNYKILRKRNQVNKWSYSETDLQVLVTDEEINDPVIRQENVEENESLSINQTNNGVNQVNNRVNQVNNRVNQTNNRVNQVNNRNNQVNNRNNQVNNRNNQVNNRVNQMNNRVNQANYGSNRTYHRDNRTFNRCIQNYNWKLLSFISLPIVTFFITFFLFLKFSDSYT